MAGSSIYELQIKAFITNNASPGLQKIEAQVKGMATATKGAAASTGVMERQLASLAARFTPVILGTIAFHRALQLVQDAIRGVAEESARMIVASVRAEETQGALAAVFGELAEQQERFIEARAQLTGRLGTDLKEFQVEAGSVLQSLGLNVAEAAKLADILTVVGTDLATALQRADKDVFDRLLGGLSGREAGVRRLGLDFGDAALKAEAFALGLGGLDRELTNSEKAFASVSLAIKGADGSLGAATRSAESFEEVQRRLQSAIAKTREELGGKLVEELLASFKALGNMETALIAIDVSLRLVADAAGLAIAGLTGMLAIAQEISNSTILRGLISGAVPGGGFALDFLAGRIEESAARIQEKIAESITVGAKMGADEMKAELGEAIQDFKKDPKNKVLGGGGTVTSTEILPGELTLKDVIGLQNRVLTDQINLFEQRARLEGELAETANERLTAAVKLADVERVQFLAQLNATTLTREEALGLLEIYDQVAIKRREALILEERVLAETKKFGPALEFARGAAGDLAGAFVDAAHGMDDAFQRAFDNMLSNLLRLQIEALLLQSLTAFATGPLGLSGATVAKFFGSAKGNVFSDGDVVPFAGGGVLSGPIAFPMRGGRTGLAGESGPEAVMPLTRDSAGRLGVRSQGGGGLNILPGAITVNASPGQSPEQIALALMAALESSPAIRLAISGAGGVTN